MLATSHSLIAEGASFDIALTLIWVLIGIGAIVAADRRLSNSGVHDHRAVVMGAVSRLRPVILAAGTSILGMTPLLRDAFFASMSVTIMGGLAVASMLTLIVVPVLSPEVWKFARGAGHEPLPGRVPAEAAHSGIPWSC